MRRLLSTLLLIGTTALATPALALDLGIAGLAILPQGELDENLDNGYGIGGQLLVPLGDGPFLLGGEISIATYADARRRFFDDLDVVTSNDIANFNLVLRAQANSGKVRPYIDAVAGLKVFQTESSLVDTCSLCEDEVLDTDTELEDSAFSYGLGFGFQIELGDSGQAFLDAGARYTRGRDALYLTRGSISDENLDDRLRESRTDTWLIHIGLTFRL